MLSEHNLNLEQERILIKSEKLNILFEALKKINYSLKNIGHFSALSGITSVITGQHWQLFVGCTIIALLQSLLRNNTVTLLVE